MKTKIMLALGAMCLGVCAVLSGCSSSPETCDPVPPECPPGTETPEKKPAEKPAEKPGAQPAEKPAEQPAPAPAPAPAPEKKPEAPAPAEPPARPEAPEPVRALPPADEFSEEAMQEKIEGMEKIKTEEPGIVRGIIAAGYGEVPSIEAAAPKAPEASPEASMDDVYRKYLDIESYMEEEEETEEEGQVKVDGAKEPVKAGKPVVAFIPAPEAPKAAEASVPVLPPPLSLAPELSVFEEGEEVAASSHSLSLEGFDDSAFDSDFEYFGQLSASLLDPEG